MHFFGRNYMMRSEKRSGMTPQNHAAPSGNGKRPPKRRRRRAGFFYKIATMLLLIVLWPVGLLLLWRRKLRWNISTKLMVCIVTLVACIVLYGFALTVDTGNPKYAAVQDSINTSLDSAADWLNGAGAFIGEKAGSVHSGIANFADALWQSHRSDIATASPTGTSASPGSAASAAVVSVSTAASRANTSFIFLIGLPPLSFPCLCMFRAANGFFAAAYSVCLSRRKRTARNLSSVSMFRVVLLFNMVSFRFALMPAKIFSS